MRILVVDDDSRITGMVTKELIASGYTVDVAPAGDMHILEKRLSEHGLIVLYLPSVNGRGALTDLPKGMSLLMLAIETPDKNGEIKERDEPPATAPVSVGDLLARVQELLRQDAAPARVVRVGDLEVDTAMRTIRRGGRDVSLSSREYALLEYLVFHEGQVVTRAALAGHVWGSPAVKSNVIDVYVRYLRQKIDAPHGTPIIHTVRGVGYILRSPAHQRVPYPPQD